MRESLVLAAGADPGRWQCVQKALGGELAVAFAIDLRGTLDLLAREKPSLLILCSDLIDASVEECLDRLDKRAPSTLRVIVIGRDGACSSAETPSRPRTVHLKADSVREGLLTAAKALLEIDSGRRTCKRAEIRQRGAQGEDELFDFPAYRPMVLGKSPAMRKVVETLRRVARVDVTVLLSGETGTGKELFARRIHCMSDRARGPFRAVSLPAVPNELFESVLFGHERGAFTGAIANTTGAFEQSREGSLFLDEVSSLGLESQPKLLRAIQEKEIERVGARGPVACDTRIVAATNAPLADAVAQGAFREDLFHRLSVVTIEIPPLRRRPEDIPLLAEFFVKKYVKEFRLEEVPELGAEAIQALKAHEWSGNVRELENRVQKALLLNTGGALEATDLFEEPRGLGAASPIHFGGCKYSLAEVEQAYISEVIQHTEGNQSRAAQILEIDRKTLRTKLQKQAPASAKSARALKAVPA